MAERDTEEDGLIILVASGMSNPECISGFEKILWMNKFQK